MLIFFFFNDTATTEIYTLSLHDALPIYGQLGQYHGHFPPGGDRFRALTRAPETGNFRGEIGRSEEHTSELQSQSNLVCRLLLEKKKIVMSQLYPRDQCLTASNTNAQ